MLSDGRWDYQKYGLLDSTHLRFFSWHTVKKLFLDSGFGIERRFDVLVPEFAVYPSAKSLCDKELGVPLNPDDHTFQYVIMASREAYKKCTHAESAPRKILVVSSDPYAPLTGIRLIKPLKAYISKHSGEIKLVHFSQFLMQHMDWPDVIIVHREISIAVLEFVRAARKREIPVVYDTDDLLVSLPAWSSQIIHQSTRDLMKNIMATADRVTCTTRPLADELEKFSDDIQIIPNVCIPSEKIPAPREKHHGDQCTLVIASSDTMPVAFWVSSVRRIVEKFDFVHLVVIGNIAHQFDFPPKNITIYKQCSEDAFSKILLGIDNGIGLLPLDDSLFSSCKSPIKFWHYATCGITAIASDVKPYSDVIEHNRNGILVDNTEEAWYSAIAGLISDHEQRRYMLARAVRDWHTGASGDIAVRAWENVFSNLPRKILYGA